MFLLTFLDTFRSGTAVCNKKIYNAQFKDVTALFMTMEIFWLRQLVWHRISRNVSVQF
jgi:hypothetical protein